MCDAKVNVNASEQTTPQKQRTHAYKKGRTKWSPLRQKGLGMFLIILVTCLYVHFLSLIFSLQPRRILMIFEYSLHLAELHSYNPFLSLLTFHFMTLCYVAAKISVALSVALNK